MSTLKYSDFIYISKQIILDDDSPIKKVMSMPDSGITTPTVKQLTSMEDSEVTPPTKNAGKRAVSDLEGLDLSNMDFSPESQTKIPKNNIKIELKE